MFFVLQIRMFTFEHAGEIHHNFDNLEVKKSLSLASAPFIRPVVAAESYDAAELVLSPMKSVVKSRNSPNNKGTVDLFGFPR